MLTVQSTEAIRQIESAIGYTFRDKRLLVQVFTRKTYMRVDPEAPDNEVLEFYGDMLMSYHVTTYFIGKFAHMLDDGLYFMRTVEQFTEMRSHYVRNQYLTERIKAMLPNIERLVRAQNPRLELPKDNQKAYADLFESLVGAVYLDSYRDDELIRAFILRHLNIEPKEGQAAPAARTRRASVTVLPSISLVDAVEPVAATDTEEPAAETFEAETAAAVILLPATPDEELPDETATVEPPAPVEAVSEEPVKKPVKDPVEIPVKDPTEPAVIPEAPAEEETATAERDALISFCREAGHEEPLIEEAPKNAPNARPVAACTVRYRDKRGKAVKISLNDSGKTLAEAKEKVAAKMLGKLRAIAPAPVVKEPVVEIKESDAEIKEPVAEAVVEAVAEVIAPAEAVEAVTAAPEAMTEVVEAEAPAVAEAAEAVIPTVAAAGTPEAPAEAVEAPVEVVEVAEAAETPAPKKPARKSTRSRAKKVEAEVAAETPAEAVEVKAEAPQKPARKSTRSRAKKAEAEVAAEAHAETPTEVPAETPAAEAAPKKPARRRASPKAKKDAAAE